MQVNKSQKIFDSNEYRVKLSDLASEIIKYSEDKDNEATIGSYFENNLYALIENLFKEKICFEKEQTNKDLHIDIFKGRIDAISNKLVIEYKRPSTFTNSNSNDVEKGINQLKKYLEQLKESGNIFDGIITDGVHYVQVYYSDGKFTTSHMRILDISGLDFMIKSIMNVNKKLFINSNLVNDFGSNSALTKLQRSLYKEIHNGNDSKTNMLFQEWMSMYHLSLNDNGKSNTLKERRRALSMAINEVLATNIDEYEALFALETGYAIIVKIFALKILPKIELSNKVEYFSDLKARSLSQLREDFESFENGYVFSTDKITNLLEQDFFSWYTNKDIWNTTIAQSIKQLVEIVDDYADTSLIYKFESTDLFRDIYMLTIPSDVRKSFGEFFTPDWLADNVLEESIKLFSRDNWTFLDPTCGSGTFLLRAINRIIAIDRKLGKKDDDILEDILNRVTGIDLNPLSVLSARVSYLLAIRPFITENTKTFEIPIYLGDSAKLPRIFKKDNIKYVEYSITTQKKEIGKIDVVLPYDFVASPQFLPTVKKWQMLIKSEQTDILSKKIKSIFPKKDDKDINKIIVNCNNKLNTFNQAA